jgi:hypothetical protein
MQQPTTQEGKEHARSLRNFLMLGNNTKLMNFIIETIEINIKRSTMRLERQGKSFEVLGVTRINVNFNG